MEKLIQNLNHDYIRLFATLDKVKLLGVHSADGQKSLQRANQRLQKQLKKFDYPDAAPLINRQELGEFRKLWRYQKNEIERFLKQSSKYTQPTFLWSIQGRESNQSFAKLISKFKKNLFLEQQLLSQELTQLSFKKSKQA